MKKELYGIKGRPRPINSRDRKMRAQYLSGKTLEEIGESFDISRQRVQQILSKYFSFKRKDGGAALRDKINRAMRDAKKEARCLKLHGHDCATHKALVRKCRILGANGVGRHRQPIGAFIKQIYRAKVRGIAWEFNLAQWCKFWQDSGKWSKRGAGGFVMCRFGGVGPYNSANCYFATRGENTKHYWERYHGELTEFSTPKVA